MSLVDVLAQLEGVDEVIQKEASEQEKVAQEEEAAGRIMARGFMDELNKLAGGVADAPSANLMKATGKKPWEMPQPKEMNAPKTIKTPPVGITGKVPK